MVKRTDVKKHTRKGRKVNAHKRKIKISRKKRKVFTGLARHDFETGGPLDFERHGLENAKIHFGDAYSVGFRKSRDDESFFHTHPPKAPLAPSLEDLRVMQTDKYNNQFIFHKKIALTIREKNKFRKVPLHKLGEIDKMVSKDLNRGMGDKTFYRKYRPIFLKELGLDMRWHGPGKSIDLDRGFV